MSPLEGVPWELSPGNYALELVPSRGFLKVVIWRRPLVRAQLEESTGRVPWSGPIGRTQEGIPWRGPLDGFPQAGPVGGDPWSRFLEWVTRRESMEGSPVESPVWEPWMDHLEVFSGEWPLEASPRWGLQAGVACVGPLAGVLCLGSPGGAPLEGIVLMGSHRQVL